nr:cellulase family glycosylhydrolase [Rubrobacteraceae bacterium]
VWASGAQTRNVPQNPADYAEFMGFLANRFKGKVAAYEVWNEPNLKRFWSTGPDPVEYAAMLRAAYPVIKAADPEAKVVFGGTSGNDYGFIDAAYTAGVKGYFDVMASHPYPYCGSTGPRAIRRTSSGRISRDSFLGYREIRATMAARDDLKPIWFTELGWNTSTTTCDPGAGVWQGGVTRERQAQYLYDAFRMIEADKYVQVALWYDFRNNAWAGDEDTPEARYGLLQTDFSPKPAYFAFRAYAHGAPYTGG